MVLGETPKGIAKLRAVVGGFTPLNARTNRDVRNGAGILAAEEMIRDASRSRQDSCQPPFGGWRGSLGSMTTRIIRRIEANTRSHLTIAPQHRMVLPKRDLSAYYVPLNDNSNNPLLTITVRKHYEFR